MQAQTTAQSGNTNYQGLSIFQQTHTIKVLGRNMTVIFTDTLSYLKTNFDTNKAFYIGKPVSTLLDDLELPVLSSDYTPPLVDQVFDVSLDFISTSEVFKRIENKGKIVSIIITFDKAILENDIVVLDAQIKAVYPNNLGDWTPFDKTFYGSRIIKDIQVFLIDNSQ